MSSMKLSIRDLELIHEAIAKTKTMIDRCDEAGSVTITGATREEIKRELAQMFADQKLKLSPTIGDDNVE
jgi:flagellar biosynthesis component FlhA